MVAPAATPDSEPANPDTPPPEAAVPGSLAPGRAVTGSRVRQRLELLLLLMRKELKIRYLGSILGYLWVLLNPLIFTLTYFVAFKVIMRFKREGYLIHLLTGMFPWLWFAQCLSRSTTCFMVTASLIKKTALERVLLPISLVLNETMHFILTLPVLIGLVLVMGHSTQWSWLYQIPLLVLVQVLVLLPLSLTIALWSVFIRDLHHLIGVSMRLLFFLTPVIYPLDMVPSRILPIILLNPGTSLIVCWRRVLLEGVLDHRMLALACGYAVVLWVLAGLSYRSRASALGEVL